MTKFSSSKNYLYALLALMVLALGACASSDEQSDSSGGDDNMSCDANDTRQECADDIM
jgi:hypothetical protein